MTLRIDMATLRRQCAFPLAEGECRGLVPSRRRFLGAAGAVGTGLLVDPAASVAAAAAPLSLVRRGGTAVFLLDGLAVWTVDPAQFAGSPGLMIRSSGKGGEPAAVELRGARYPGTAVVVDLRATVRHASGGYLLRLELTPAGRRGAAWLVEVDFRRWLAGTATAGAPLSAAQAKSLLGQRPLRQVTLGFPTGMLEASISPALGLSLSSLAEPLEVRGLPETPLRVARLSLRPLDPTSPSLVTRPARRRSLLALERGPHRWPVRLERRHPDGWALRGEGHNVFDSLQVEAWPGGHAVQFLPGAEAAGRLLFHPAPGTVALALDRPVLAVTRGRTDEAFAVVGSFAKQAGWLSHGSCRLELGAEPTTATFALAATPKMTDELTCAPTLKTLIAPLPGAVTGPVDLRGRGIHLIFHLARLDPRLPTDHVAERAIASVRERGTLADVTVPFTFSVDVVRPDDMLALQFSGVNLTLRVQGAEQSLVRSDPATDAYLIVTFPPQHVAEQAFYQPTPGLPLPAGDPDAGSSGGDPTAAVKPLPARLAGPSRLAFLLPRGIDTLPYTLRSLLDWSGYTLSVPATAVLSLDGSPPVLPPPEAEEGGVTIQALRLAALRVRGRSPSLVRQRVLDVPSIAAPAPHETALEVPYRLVVSPNEAAAWAHAGDPVNHGTARTELWHTRLGVRGRDAQGRPTVDEARADVRTLRAVWSPDYYGPTATAPRPDSGEPFRVALTAEERRQLVALMATRAGGAGDSTPAAVTHLMLSALGGWLTAHGHWDPSKGLYGGQDLAVQDWRHGATMGRDHYVHVVHRGYLFPFGHRAALVKTTQREFVPQPGSTNTTAYLVQRMSIVLCEPVKTYDGSGDEPYAGRAMPHRTVRIKTGATPNLDDPTGPPSTLAPAQGTNAFWPAVDGHVFRFHMEGEDQLGHLTEWTQPLIFVDATIAFDAGPGASLGQVITYYVGLAPTDPLVRCDMNRQKVTYAAPHPSEPGGTTLPTVAQSFAALPPAAPRSSDGQAGRWLSALRAARPRTASPGAASVLNGQADQPAFWPALAQTIVDVEAIQHLTAGAGPDGFALVYPAQYLKDEANAAQLFLSLDPNAPGLPAPVQFAADQAGGLATPNFGLLGLSRTQGPLGGLGGLPPNPSPDDVKNAIARSLADAAAARFDPSDFLKDAHILGDIKLTDVIAEVTNFTAAPEKVPQIKTRLLYRASDGSETATPPPPQTYTLPVAAETSIIWQPDVRSWNSIFLANGDTPSGGQTLLRIDGRLRTELAPGKAGASTSTMTGVLTNFSVNLLPAATRVIQLDFTSLTFTSQTGQKPRIEPQVANVEFVGPLAFVEDLKPYLGDVLGNKGGSSALANRRALAGLARVPVHAATPSGPSLDVTAAGITAGYTLAIPSVSVGIFGIQNIKLSAGLTLPFNGSPVTVRFAFCQRDDPFLLTVCGFAGGGFVGLELSARGIDLFEGALEFGGNLALDLVVASGGAYVMAGIYFKVEQGPTQDSPPSFTLAGYLRCGGALSVLGLITISVEFYLSLTYQNEGGQASLVGEATVTVEVDVGFISKSVSLTVRKQFAGSSGSASAGQRHLAALGLAPVPAAPRFTDAMPPASWNAYVAAFA